MKPRFKIDIHTYSTYCPVALFMRDSRMLFADVWKFVESFKTREEAMAHYELIKDLPEYLV